MKIAIASDHAGFDLKQDLTKFLRQQQHDVIDLGTNSRNSVDYPDFAEAAGKSIKNELTERAVLICGSGVGASVAANKLPGIRAGLCHDVYSARQGVEHDAMNALVLGARVIGTATARELVGAFVAAEFTGEERHQRRLRKIIALEEKFAGAK